MAAKSKQQFQGFAKQDVFTVDGAHSKRPLGRDKPEPGFGYERLNRNRYQMRFAV